MANAVTEEKTLVIQNENEQDTIYKQKDMTDEAKVIYAKLELVTNNVNTLKANTDLQLEQHSILQRHYLEVLKPLLSSDEAITAKDATDEKAKGKRKK